MRSETSGPQVALARADDLESIVRMLAGAGLPTAGVAEHLSNALVARAGCRVVGCVALELYGEEALLRSLAVVPAVRGSGLGIRLAEAEIELARAWGAKRVWLLTTTAERFFPRFGFERVERSALPSALEASAELRGACPASAIAMRREF